MPRLPRFRVPDLPLRVIARGNDRAPIFGGTDDLRFSRECLLRTSREHGVAIHAYVLMTNQVRLLATPSHETSLPAIERARAGPRHRTGRPAGPGIPNSHLVLPR
jgi:putative transposase